MNDKEIQVRLALSHEAVKLQQMFIDEVLRIQASGLVSNITSVSGIFRVALENIAIGYNKSHDHDNLTRI
jgi:hypothetical protein